MGMTTPTLEAALVAQIETALTDNTLPRSRKRNLARLAAVAREIAGAPRKRGRQRVVIDVAHALRLRAEGMSYRAIAEKLGASESTVTRTVRDAAARVT